MSRPKKQTLEEKRKRVAEYAVRRRKENPAAKAAHVACSTASIRKRRANDPEFVAAQRAYQAAYHKKRSEDPAYLERKSANTKRLRSDPGYLERERAAGLESDRIRQADPEFTERKREYMRYRHQEPGVKVRHRLTAQRRRARLNDACSTGVTPAEWEAICQSYTDEAGDVACAYCRKPCAATIDHVVPIARGGRDEPGNVVPCCRFCNTSKGARLLSEWHRAPKDFAVRNLCHPQNNNSQLPQLDEEMTG